MTIALHCEARMNRRQTDIVMLCKTTNVALDSGHWQEQNETVIMYGDLANIFEWSRYARTANADSVHRNTLGSALLVSSNHWREPCIPSRLGLK
jgi:hypothetical protein